MKKIAFLLILFGAFSMMSKAQIPPPMMSESVSWKILTISTDLDQEESVSYYDEVILYHAGYIFGGDGGIGYALMTEWRESQVAIQEWYNEISIVFKTEGGVNWDDRILLYDFAALEGDTIVHGPVYKNFPRIGPEDFLKEAAEKSDNCFSIVRKIEDPEYRRQMIVDCFTTWIDPDTGIKDTLYLGTDVWVDGVGSIYGLYASWAHLAPKEASSGMTYDYHTMSMRYYGFWAYSNPDYPDPEMFQSLNEVNVPDLNVSYDESSKELTVSSENSAPAVFQLIDLSGRLISQVSFSGDTAISLKGYAEGIYLCRIIRDSQSVYSSKIKL